jgi:predicted nucleic acid-binding protein
LGGFALDANCLIAAVSESHSARDLVQREVDRRLAASEPMILPAHALTEAFSVLTRLPSNDRLSPAQAMAALEAGFLAVGSVSSLDAAAYRVLLTRLAAGGVIGGRVYDEVIAETAARAGATTLLTLNPKHFPSPPAGLTILDPKALVDPDTDADP